MEFNRQTVITFPDDTDIPNITTGIVSGSLNLEEILCSKNFEFGDLNASKFEAQIYKLPDVSSKKIVVYQTEGNNKIVLFTGIVDSCKKDKSGYYRDIIAYDESYSKRDTNVAEWCNDFWKTRTSSNLKTFRTELLKYMNIVDVIKPLYNDDLIISKLPELESIPFGTLLSSICQVQLCFPHINRLGTLEYITLSTDKNTAISVTEIEGNNSTFETYYTANITRVQVYSGNDLIGIAGLEGNNYNIKDNIIFDNLGKERSQELAESMLNKLSTISMAPCEVKMLYSHLDYKLGDYIYVNGVYSYIMNNTLSGIRLVEQIIKGDADEYFSQTTAFNTTVQYAKDKVAAVLATLEAEYVKVSVADITYATIENLNATNASIDNLKTNKLDATYADIINANVESLKAVNADIANLKVDYEKVGILDASVADIKTLIFGSATGTTITTDFSNSVIAVLGEAQIKSAMIDSLDASKITALDINTTNVLVHSEDGRSQWEDNTIQISDSERVRVQIGKDANSDYNMYIWDKAGNLMFDAIGLTDKGIQRQVIRDDMVKDNANIAASKLNIESLFNVINNDGSHTLNSTKIYVDSEQQTLDSVFKSIQTTVGGNSTLWGSAIKQSKDFIDQKLWWTDIRNGESIESKFNTVTSTLDSFGVQIGDVYKQLNDDFKVYQVTYEPTKDNYPANEWSVPIYPSDDRYPSDSTWQYTEAEYDNYVGIIAYWEAQNRAWRWIKKIDGTHGWKEISSTEIAYLLNQNAALKVNLNIISSELSKTQIDIRDNYSTTVQVNNAITQAVSAESNSIKSEISTTYVTKNTLTDYSTTEAMNNAITQAITKESNSIKLEVSNNYATKKSLESYATTASLEAYIKKDPTTGELKSAIEAIADDITLKAKGTINISGNKSVNINGNLFTLTSTNTTISADGSIDCKKLKAVDADLEGTFKNVNVTDGGITMTTTIIGGEYLIKSSTGAFLQIQGHYIEMSNDDGSGTKWILSRSECVFNDYLNVKLYHPSLKNYMRPALSMRNPVTFDWSGSVLTIYVDNVAVATWDWAEKNWY